MHVFTAAHQVIRSSQECAVILDRHQASHAADHEAPCRYAKLLPDLPGALGTGEKPLRIHAVMNQTEFVSRAPGLPGMIVPQIPRHGEHSVGHRVTTAAEEPAPERKTPESFQFVSVFAVDGNWNPGHPGGGNPFKRTEITCVNDVRPKFLHDTRKTEERKLQAGPRARHRVRPRGRVHSAHKLSVRPADRTDAMLEIFFSQPSDNLQNPVLGAARAQTAPNVQHPQPLDPRRHLNENLRRSGTWGLGLRLRLHCFACLTAEVHRAGFLAPAVSSHGNQRTRWGPIMRVNPSGILFHKFVASSNFGLAGEKFGKLFRRTSRTW